MIIQCIIWITLLLMLSIIYKTINSYHKKINMKYDNPMDLIGEKGQIILKLEGNYIGMVELVEILLYSDEELQPGDNIIITKIENAKIYCKKA